MKLSTKVVLEHVSVEREMQDLKWKRQPGKWNDPDGIKYMVLGEEVGEVANALLERKSKEELYKELIQVAAVAVMWAETVNSIEKE